MNTAIPAGMPAIWRSGDYTGKNRPIARITLQQANVNLYDYELATNTASTSAAGAGAGTTDPGGTGSSTEGGGTYLVTSTIGGGTTTTLVGGGSVVQADGSGGTGTAASTGVTASAETDARQSSGTVHQTYASIIFGSSAIPKEMPNIANVQWNRSIGQDFATCTLKFYNTVPLPVGTVPTRDLDFPGFFTYNRGESSYSNRWGSTPNEWSNLLMPDNIIRTYEGYGFDPLVIPENDLNLAQSGTWRIDKVAYDNTGIITVTCRDVGSILGDQIIFVPVVPPDFYPLSFAASDSPVGVVGPQTYTYSQDTSGNTDPQHPAPASWTGPLDPPLSVAVTNGDDSIAVTWDAPAADLPAPTGTTKGYSLVGYRLVVDGVVLPTIYTTFDGGSANVPAKELVNGNTYEIQVVAIYKELLNSAGELYFKTNVENEQEGEYSTGVQGRPGVTSGPIVTVNSIDLNTDDSGDEAPGYVGWSYTQGDSATVWTVIQYDSNGGTGENYTYTVTTTETSGMAAVNIGTVYDQTAWNFLVYGTNSAGHIGPGDVHFAEHDGAYYGAPVDGAAPHDPGPHPKAPVVKTTGGKGKGSSGSPLRPNAINLNYSDSSNNYPNTHTVVSGDTLWALAQYYFGDATKWTSLYQANKDLIERTARAHGFASAGNGHWIFPGEKLKIPASFGHDPKNAFDNSNSSYWLSDGHTRSDGASDMEWIEAKMDRVTLTQVRFNTVKTGYRCYVSVYARGTWVKHNSNDVIPYKATDSDSNNHSKIPYTESLVVDSASSTVVTFRTPIPGATKVRLTFHNLQNFSEGDPPYRVAVQNFTAYGATGAGNSLGSTGTAKTITVTAAPVVAGPPQDDNDPDIVQTWTEYIPAHFEVGAGANPGAYNDYTDIIKLLVSWGGFFWPENAERVLSDGTVVQYSFGEDEFGLSNIDPVLGNDGSGRAWGDFDQTGTAGPATMTVDQWDKQSLMDGISTVRDIIGFIFYIDEQGGVVWRQPNYYTVGNWLSSYADEGARTSTIIEIDEEQTLMGITATLDGTNVRERVFVATTTGSYGALASGWNPNPTGLRRVAGWTDMNFQSDEECQIMADLIAIQQLFLYRTDQLTIPAYPCIQVDDQVRIFEQVTGESYIHYVSGITSTLDMEGGSWTYQLNTNWLGEEPGDLWVFDTSQLAAETQEYLTALTIPAGAALESTF